MRGLGGCERGSLKVLSPSQEINGRVPETVCQPQRESEREGEREGGWCSPLAAISCGVTKRPWRSQYLRQSGATRIPRNQWRRRPEIPGSKGRSQSGYEMQMEGGLRAAPTRRISPGNQEQITTSSVCLSQAHILYAAASAVIYLE